MNTTLDWFDDERSWLRLIQNAMREDFSWGREVERYVEMFRTTAQRDASSSA
jgi:glycogen synthase